ncbi:MAG: SdiA-regulated domain-containing protein [Burkholderiales bacterium]|jgi:uncharacterized protein YjiK
MISTQRPGAGVSSKLVLAAALALSAASAHAQWAGLGNYQLVGNYSLPTISPRPFSAPQFEASAVTWNRDTNTLFMLGDGGGYIMETSLTGTPIGYMSLAAGTSPQGNEFYDPEGLTYIGNGQYVMTEERYRTAVQFTYAAGSSLQRSQTSTVKLATTIGNTGLEGITYDPVTGGFILVNERAGSGAAQNIFQTGIDFAAGTATNGSATTINNAALFPATNTGLPSLNDVYALANVYGTGTGNLLVLSQSTLVEMTRSGTLVSSLALPGLANGYQVEGITLDASGNLYLVSDNGDAGTNSSLLVYAPVPEPETWLMLVSGLALAGRFARRRAGRATA